MYVIGLLEDQLGLIVWGTISKFPFQFIDPYFSNFYIYQEWFRGLLTPWLTNEPITWTIVSLTLQLFGPNSYSALVALSVLLTFIFSFKLFRRFKYGLCYAAIFTFSAHMWSHISRHISLSQIWVHPLFFLVWLSVREREKKSARDVFKLAAVIALAFLVSSYDGFIVLITFTFLTFVETLSVLRNRKHFLQESATYVFTVVTSLAFILVPLGSYIQANYFNNDPASEQIYLTNKRIKRPIEDFFTFSSRPWYFVIPPANNPLLGGLSEKIVKSIETTNYFLADDYFPAEHAGNYFGISLLILFMYILWRVFKSPGVESKNIKTEYRKLLGVLLITFLFMMPPYLTVSGLKIYTPGILFYHMFPMFRVTSRFSVMMLLIILYMVGTGADHLTRGNKKNPFLGILPFLTVLVLAETFIPVKITKMPEPPEVYEYMSQNLEPGAIFAVYPYSQTDEAFFWLSVHKQYLLNPRGYVNLSYDSAILTHDLITLEGLKKLPEYGAKYLVVFKRIKPSDLTFFASAQNLNLIEELPDSLVYEIVE